MAIGDGYMVQYDANTEHKSTAKEVVDLVASILEREEKMKLVPPLLEPCPRCHRSYCMCDALEKK